MSGDKLEMSCKQLSHLTKISASCLSPNVYYMLVGPVRQKQSSLNGTFTNFYDIHSRFYLVQFSSPLKDQSLTWNKIMRTLD